MSIEYDGPGPLDRARQELEPASGFERLVARAARWMGSKAKDPVDLVDAIRRLDAKKTRELALAGANLDSPEGRDGCSAMEAACRAPGRFGGSMVKLFLSLGANPNVQAGRLKRSSLAIIALESRQWEGAKALMLAMKSPLALDADGGGLWAALAAGAASMYDLDRPEGDLEDLAKMIDGLGDDPNREAKDQTRPLWLGAPNPRMVKALLEAGADPNAKGAGGTTPLMQAASFRSAGGLLSMRELLDGGADATMLDDQGRDAMWWLMRGGMRLHHKLPRGIDRWAQMLLDAGLGRMERSRFEGSPQEESPEPRWMRQVKAAEEAQALEGEAPAPRSASAKRL